MTAQTPEPHPPPRTLPFGLRAIVGLLILQMIIEAVSIFLIVSNPYPEWVDTSNVPLWEVGVLGAQIVWTIWVVAGVWLRRGWVWSWLMLLFAYSLANGLRSYFWGEPDYVTMFLNVLMVLYLNQSEVQQLFLRPSTDARSRTEP